MLFNITSNRILVDEESRKLGKLVLEQRGLPPSLTILQVGDNPVSTKYIQRKQKKIAEFHWHSDYIKLSQDLEPQSLIRTIQNIKTDGIILQLPLPKNFSLEILEEIPPNKDVDGLTCFHQGRLFKGYPTEAYLQPCTVAACLHVLKSAVPIQGVKAAVFGNSNLVGKPVSILLRQMGATVTNLSSSDPDQASISRNADIVVAAMGNPHYLNQSYINPNAFVLDVGTTVVDGKVLGDVDPGVQARYISPPIGGIGPLTVSFLMLNLAKCALLKFT